MIGCSCSIVVIILIFVFYSFIGNAANWIIVIPRGIR